MRNKILIAGALVLLIGALAFAGQAQNRMQHNGAALQVMHPVNAEVVTLTGTVITTNLAAGQGMPSIGLRTGAGDFTVMVGPYRLLANSKFEIKAGQALEVKAFQDPRVANTYAATEIKDLESGALVVLRDAAGMPHPGGPGRGMMGGGRMAHGAQGMQGMGGMGMQGTCAHFPNGLDANTKLMFEGAVESVNMAAGQGSPSFVLMAGGNRLTIYACPYRALVQAGFQVTAGDKLSVIAYPVPGADGSYLAAELTNLVTGKTLKLR